VASKMHSGEKNPRWPAYLLIASILLGAAYGNFKFTNPDKEIMKIK